jgi:hypothetical protein
MDDDCRRWSGVSTYIVILCVGWELPYTFRRLEVLHQGYECWQRCSDRVLLTISRQCNMLCIGKCRTNLPWLAHVRNTLYNYLSLPLEPSTNLIMTVCKLLFLLTTFCNLLNMSPQFFSTRIKKVFTITGEDLTRSFDAEARRHLDHIRDIPSLATVQGLLIMFIVSCYLGQDKAGVIYRHLGYDMLDNLRIEDRMNFTREPQEKAAYCKAEWGIYCYER